MKRKSNLKTGGEWSQGLFDWVKCQNCGESYKKYHTSKINHVCNKDKQMNKWVLAGLGSFGIIVILVLSMVFWTIGVSNSEVTLRNTFNARIQENQTKLCYKI